MGSLKPVELVLSRKVCMRNYQLKGCVKEPNISIYFVFPPITQWCSISDVLFNGGRGVSDFSVLKYY